ncbi:unnamed protein product [Coffea canephora]|uniref:DH200=94 genomic scaffold, scaffold_259 n=1 Tax=Coffea canephora TaxID=49390 RepID=A0A068VG00_COFCA|nr:unnamed protein product [Coffea canephora]
MGSKTLLLFFISLAIVLAITPQVAARELAEASTSVDNSKALVTPDRGDPSGRVSGVGPGGGWHRDGGYGGYPGQAVDAEP